MSGAMEVPGMGPHHTRGFQCMKYTVIACNAFLFILCIFNALFGLAYPIKEFPGGYTGSEASLFSLFVMGLALVGYCGACLPKRFMLITYSLILLGTTILNIVLWILYQEESVLGKISESWGRVVFFSLLDIVLIIVPVVLAFKIGKSNTTPRSTVRTIGLGNSTGPPGGMLMTVPPAGAGHGPAGQTGPLLGPPPGMRPPCDNTTTTTTNFNNSANTANNATVMPFAKSTQQPNYQALGASPARCYAQPGPPRPTTPGPPGGPGGGGGPPMLGMGMGGVGMSGMCGGGGGGGSPFTPIHGASIQQCPVPGCTYQYVYSTPK